MSAGRPRLSPAPARSAGCIFSGNVCSGRIAMTAPVAQQQDADGRRTIRLFLPASLAEFHDPPWTLPPPRRDEAVVPVATPSQPTRSRP